MALGASIFFACEDNQSQWDTFCESHDFLFCFRFLRTFLPMLGYKFSPRNSIFHQNYHVSTVFDRQTLSIDHRHEATPSLSRQKHFWFSTKRKMTIGTGKMIKLLTHKAEFNQMKNELEWSRSKCRWHI